MARHTRRRRRSRFPKGLLFVLVCILLVASYHLGAVSNRTTQDWILDGVNSSLSETQAGLSLPVSTKTTDTLYIAVSADTASLPPTQSPTQAPTAVPTEKPTQQPTSPPAAKPENTFKPLSQGSEGEDVRNLQNRLNKIGFSAGSADGKFGKNTANALKGFQAAAGLSATGTADEETIRLLYSDEALLLSPTKAPEPKEKKSSEPTVWIPRTGECYHSRKSCSNMKNPSNVTITEAKNRGYRACKKCY